MSTGGRLRVVIADDERPARHLLASLLRQYDDVELVGEASDGATAVELIERVRPELALLDLQMPELDGFEVVRSLRPDRMPLVAFVTAHDEYAVQAFEANAIDYLLKPVDPMRLRRAIARAIERLEHAALRQSRAEQMARLDAAAGMLNDATRPTALRRIPVRRRDDVILVPVEQLACAIADGELLHLTTRSGERHTITYRLKDLEARLPADDFVRLSRGSLAAVDAIARVSPIPGGTYVVTLRTGQELAVSRTRARLLREQLLRL